MVGATLWLRELQYILSNAEEIEGHRDALYLDSVAIAVDGEKDEARIDVDGGYSHEICDHNTTGAIEVPGSCI